jgi:prephenate dehydrogenase
LPTSFLDRTAAVGDIRLAEGFVMKRVVVVGTGFIGTSVALALRAHGVTVHLMDRDPEALETALAMGAGTPAVPPAAAELAVIAVPPLAVAPVLARAQADRLAYAFTDVASVKRWPLSAVAGMGGDMASVVGGHPLVSGEQGGGAAAARPDLFDRQPWALVRTSRTRTDVLNRAFELLALCGSVPVLVEAGQHDRAVAVTSHVPHVLAALTAEGLLDSSPAELRLAGLRLSDATRSAAESPALWAKTLAANAAYVADGLEAFVERTERMIAQLRDVAQGTAADTSLLPLLRRATLGRSRVWPSRGGAVSSPERAASAGAPDVAERCATGP